MDTLKFVAELLFYIGIIVGILYLVVGLAEENE